MPYPSQTSAEAILDKAREVIAAEGVSELSLGRLASLLGVKAPSLYRYFASKEALLKAINEGTVQDLFAALHQDDDPSLPARERLIRIARAYRRYVHANPAVYMLAMTNADDALRPDPDALVAGVLPFQAIIAEMCGESGSLTALRGLLAIMHGYALLEINGQLRRGGDLAAAYDHVIAAYLNGISRA